MQIVIDISKHIYEHAKEQSEDSNDEWDAMRAIANGIPLPEGHGKIIDASNLLTVTDVKSDGSEFTYVSYSEIDGASAIIEADKAESEGQDADSN